MYRGSPTKNLERRIRSVVPISCLGAGTHHSQMGLISNNGVPQFDFRMEIKSTFGKRPVIAAHQLSLLIVFSVNLSSSFIIFSFTHFMTSANGML